MIQVPRSHPWQCLGIVLGLLLIGDLLWASVRFPLFNRGRILQAADLPLTSGPVLVLGAGVLPDRTPSPMLQDRLETALALYQAGKVRWFLVSGDNRSAYYNEPNAMRRWLIKEGVPPALIVSDYAGRRTYDSLKRARSVFGIRRLVIVTSDFHMDRAVYTATHVGLEAFGVPASTEAIPWYSRINIWAREYGARHKALLDTWFPPDTMLGPREVTPEDWLLSPPAPEAPSESHATQP
ncbi:MAG TPA: ElyC/SanA/YdcF family protein [Holophaga sp.]|nr:ElyC/SanA/YdcF family protein [Holophaga sp.]